MIRPRKSRVPFSAGIRDFSSTKILPTGCGGHTDSCSVSNCGSFTRGKVTGNETDHSPPFSADVENKWHYTSTLYTLVACVGTNSTFWAVHAFV